MSRAIKITDELYVSMKGKIHRVIGYLISQEGEIERLDIEVKALEPLDAKSKYGAQIAKAVMALCNHGGGIIVVGFRKAPEGYYKEDVSDEKIIHTWEKTRLHDLLKRFMDPVPEVELFIEPGKLSQHPVLVVPPHQTVPVVCTRDSDVTRAGAVYIRKSGPKSEEPSNALEWQALLRRCVLADKRDLISAFRAILEPPQIASNVGKEHDQFYQLISNADKRFGVLLSKSKSPIAGKKFGRWIIAYQLNPSPPSVSLKELYHILEQSKGKETGWPIGVILHNEYKPYPWHNCLEAWMPIEDRQRIDYWRAKPTGFFYATRAFYEDLRELRVQTHRPVLEWIMPIWRMAEGILHALRAAKAYKTAVNNIRFFACYHGLTGRVLWNGNPDIVGPFRDYVCRIDVWSNEIVIPADLNIESLPDVVRKLLTPLYEQFDLFEMPAEVYTREISRMLQHRY